MCSVSTNNGAIQIISVNDFGIVQSGLLYGLHLVKLSLIYFFVALYSQGQTAYLVNKVEVKDLILCLEV